MSNSIRNENFLKGFVVELTPTDSVTLAPEGLARLVFDGQNVLLSKNGSNFGIVQTGGGSGGSHVELGVTLSGPINGANRSFSTPVPFSEISVYLNGVKQIQSSDFTVTGPSSIEMATAPTAGSEPDSLTCDLVVA